MIFFEMPDTNRCSSVHDTCIWSCRYRFLYQSSRLRPGGMLSKLDIKESYQMVPVNLRNWFLQGMLWNGRYNIDTRLPFGLRSALKIFTAVADALQWIFLQQGLRDLLHYLDDFLFVEPAGQSGQALPKALATCTTLGVPVVPEKLEGPTTTLTFLGIELDTI